MTRYAVGLGSNLGDRLGHMRAAASGLSALGETSFSSIYETEPVGGPDQGPYLNAVAVVTCDLEPADLLEHLQQIEASEKRERTQRWAARTLDLDIVASDGPLVNTPDLVVPHPRAAEREFVLGPLVDVWPEAPVADGADARTALARLGDQGVDRLANVWVDSLPEWIGRLFVAVQLVWFVAIALALVWDGSVPSGELEPLRILGIPIAVSGAALAFAASRRLGPAMTPLPEPALNGLLVEDGPYRFVRHPIYGGVTAFVLGTALILSSFAGTLLSLGLFPFFYVKSQYEERLLRLTYSGYREYREVVSRRLIPFLF